MKKALALIAILATVTAASATVRIFFTNADEGYGLTDPSLATTVSVYDAGPPAVYDDYNNYAVSSFPPSDYNNIPVAEPGDLINIWLRFEGEADGAKINGIHLGTTGGTNHTFYKMQGYYVQRWQNVELNELSANPSIMKAVTSDGIVNAKKNSSDPLFDTTTRTALLGAFEYGGGDEYLVLADLGISIDAAPRPSLTFGFAPAGMTEEINTNPDPEPSPDATWTTTYPNLTPEPASLLLLGLAGLVLRRR